MGKSVYFKDFNEVAAMPEKRASHVSSSRAESGNNYKNLFCILAAMNYSEIEFENYSKFVKEFKNKAFQSILSKNFLHPELEALQFVSILIMIFEYTEKEHIKEQICALLAILCQMIIKNIVDNSINFELNILMPIQYLLDFLKVRQELIKNVSLLKIMKSLVKLKKLSRYSQKVIEAKDNIDFSETSESDQSLLVNLGSNSSSRTFQLWQNSDRLYALKCAKKFTKDEINEFGQLVYFDKCLVFVLNANNADPTLKDEILEEAEQIFAPESSETSKNSSSDDNLKKFSLEKLVFDTNVWLEDLEFCQKLVEEYKLVLGVPNTVTKELKKISSIKSTNELLTAKAYDAYKFIFKSLASKNKSFELLSTTQNNQTTEIKIENDDLILKACQETKNIVLVSNDVNLLNKSNLMKIRCMTLSELKLIANIS